MQLKHVLNLVVEDMLIGQDAKYDDAAKSREFREEGKKRKIGYAAADAGNTSKMIILRMNSNGMIDAIRYTEKSKEDSTNAFPSFS